MKVHFIGGFQWLLKIATAALGLIMLAAAFSKIGDLKEFYKVLKSIAFLGGWSCGVVLMILPGLELVVGLCLLVKYALREATLILAILLVIFILFGVYSFMTTGSNLNCHCFKIPISGLMEITGGWVIVRNIGLLILDLLIFFNTTDTPYIE